MKILLKDRPIDSRLMLPITIIRPMLEMDEQKGRDELWKFFAPARMTKMTINDREWFDMIIRWAPSDGLSVVDLAKWLKLADKFQDLPEDSTEVEISDFQMGIIWDRLNDPRFKVTKADAAFVRFLLELSEVTGRHFKEEDPTNVS